MQSSVVLYFDVNNGLLSFQSQTNIAEPNSANGRNGSNITSPSMLMMISSSKMGQEQPHFINLNARTSHWNLLLVQDTKMQLPDSVFKKPRSVTYLSQYKSTSKNQLPSHKLEYTKLAWCRSYCWGTGAQLKWQTLCGNSFMPIQIGHL